MQKQAKLIKVKSRKAPWGRYLYRMEGVQHDFTILFKHNFMFDTRIKSQTACGSNGASKWHYSARAR